MAEKLKAQPISDDEIERVARAICANLGLDPDERVGMGVADTWTDLEACQHTYVPMICLIQERWIVFRREAARAIAGRRALGGHDAE